MTTRLAPEPRPQFIQMCTRRALSSVGRQRRARLRSLATGDPEMRGQS